MRPEPLRWLLARSVTGWAGSGPGGKRAVRPAQTASRYKRLSIFVPMTVVRPSFASVFRWCMERRSVGCDRPPNAPPPVTPTAPPPDLSWMQNLDLLAEELAIAKSEGTGAANWSTGLWAGVIESLPGARVFRCIGTAVVAVARPLCGATGRTHARALYRWLLAGHLKGCLDISVGA
jgi:hypothetical protein